METKVSTMPPSETYTALQRGTVVAIGFPYSYTFAAYKLDCIDSQAWLTDVLGRIDDHKIIRIDELIPRRDGQPN